jgi:hypothetical protein
LRDLRDPICLVPLGKSKKPRRRLYRTGKVGLAKQETQSPQRQIVQIAAPAVTQAVDFHRRVRALVVAHLECGIDKTLDVTLTGNVILTCSLFVILR